RRHRDEPEQPADRAARASGLRGRDRPRHRDEAAAREAEDRGPPAEPPDPQRGDENLLGPIAPPGPIPRFLYRSRGLARRIPHDLHESSGLVGTSTLLA